MKMPHTVALCLFVASLAMPSLEAQLDASGALAGLSRLQDAVSRRESSSDPNWDTGNGDARRLEPGETLVLADIDGPGVITHFWNTIATKQERYSKLISLRIYWDHEEHPSVEAPLGDFFGVGHGMDVPFESLPVNVSSEGRARNCYWPMPFRKHARFEATNEGTLPIDAFYFQVDWEKRSFIAEDEAYFHASYRQEFPTEMGKRFLIADIEGRGHYVGTVQSVRQRLDSWYGEGDDFFFLDGDESPTLRGTGSEDYFLDAWGFRLADSAFYGAPIYEGEIVGGRTSVYRWHIADPVRFAKSLRVEIEHVGPTVNDYSLARVGYGERPDDMATVAFWYQVEPHKPWPAMAKGQDRLYPGGFEDLPFGPEVDEKFARIWLNTAIEDRVGAPSPLRFDSEIAMPHPMELEVFNPTGVPVEVRGVLPERIDFTIPNGSFQVDVAPRETEIVKVDLQALERVDLRGAAPLGLELHLLFKPEGGDPMEMILPRNLYLEAPFACRTAPASPRVDGDLTDWTELPFVMAGPVRGDEAAAHWTGPEDSSFRFGLARDEQFVYVAVDARDEERVKADNSMPWHQDGVEIRINAQADPMRSASKGQGEFSEILLIAVPSGAAAPFNPRALPEGVQAVNTVHAGGHRTEVAIPVAWLDAQQGSGWSKFRLNVTLDDTDGVQLCQLWWRPDWRKRLSHDASGTFVKQ
ncbi:MAG: DUF2961 domain-containing protein [Candidatus Hydrogenedentes bacterium]|nr:DUF2961 domain-containing protein [Candidatus Hydrogenedentota bacterium]